MHTYSRVRSELFYSVCADDISRIDRVRVLFARRTDAKNVLAHYTVRSHSYATLITFNQHRVRKQKPIIIE